MKPHRSTLESLFAAHRGKVSDKWAIYIAEYDRLFQPYRDKTVRLLEIGVQNGGSLEIWSKFFSSAEKLVGSDINPACEQLQFDDLRIKMVVANANSNEAEQRIVAQSATFDIIIDDGSHQSGDIVRSFARYFPHLTDGGVYIAEDLHCSYWQDFEGGIFQPYSSVAFFKRLADTINHEHWGVDKTRSELLDNFNSKYDTIFDEITLARIHSIEFINSMCVIKKAPSSDNELGKRFIAGVEALVDQGPVNLHGSSGALPNQSTNSWSSRDVSPEDELVARIEEIGNLNGRINERDTELANLRLTAAEGDQTRLAELDQARQQIETQRLLQLAEREKAFSDELLQLRQSHERQTSERDSQHTEREQTLLAQLNQARQQIVTQLLQLAEREKVFSDQLLQLQQSHERQTRNQARR